MLDVSRLDKKATLRAEGYTGKRAEGYTGNRAEGYTGKRAEGYKGTRAVSLPSLREEESPETSSSEKGARKKRSESERLQKIIAAAGVCSRRRAEELILLGSVKVNGEIVNTLGAKANPVTDIISVDGKVIEPDATENQYYLLNKPRGYITSTSDPQGRPTVMDLMASIETRIYPVGRLDYASEGLIILTNDGDMANRLMHPSSEVKRTYSVKIKGDVTEDQLRQLRKGIQLSDGFVKPLRVSRGERLQNKEWIEVTVTEGKNLEIRRLFAVLGLEVDRLRRTGIGPLVIEQVPVGKFVRLTKSQVEGIFAKELKSAKKPLIRPKY